MKGFSVRLARKILFILIFITSIYFWINTQTGLATTIWIISKLIPGELHVAQISGRLLGPIHFSKISYVNNDIDFKAHYLDIDWQLKYLIQQQLVVKKLEINQAVLIVKPNDAETDTDTTLLKTLINHVKLSKVKVDKLLIKYRNSLIKVYGQLEEDWQLNWQVSIPALKEFSDNLSGSLVLQGKIDGAYNSPQLSAHLQQSTLKINGWQLNRLQGDFKLSLNPYTWNLKLNIPLLQNKNTRINPINIQATGELDPFSFQIRLAKFNLLHTTDEGDSIKLNLPGSQLQSFIRQQALRTEFKFDTQRVFSLNALLNLPNYVAKTPLKTSQPIQGEIHLLLRQLDYLNLVLPKLKHLRGLLRADINLAGTFANPRVAGQIALQNTSGQIPALGLTLNNIQINAFINPESIRWLGSLRSGSGLLTAEGRTLLKSKNFPTILTLQGKNLIVSNSYRYKIIATPNLQIKGDTTNIDVTGNVFLPYAHIKFGGAEESAVIDLSKDVIFVDDKKNNIEDVLTITSRIHLRFGEEVKFRYEGLHTYLRGALDIIELPKRPTMARGEIKLFKGHYKYYGNTLELKEGSKILFAGGPIDNPTLNVTAIKIVDAIPQSLNLLNVVNPTTNTNTNIAPGTFSTLAQSSQPIKIIVGLRVHGYAQNPQFTLFSEPAILGQPDILSYLVIGEPSNQLSAASAQLLFNAATNLSDLKSVTKSLQQGVGLDTLSVQNTTYVDPATNTLAQNPSLLLGKALSPRLLINYSIGLLQPVNVLQVSYLINKYFSVQSTNSTLASGLDLLYKVEK